MVCTVGIRAGESEGGAGEWVYVLGSRGLLGGGAGSLNPPPHGLEGIACTVCRAAWLHSTYTHVDKDGLALVVGGGQGRAQLQVVGDASLPMCATRWRDMRMADHHSERVRAH